MIRMMMITLMMGGSMHLCNVVLLRDYNAQHPTRLSRLHTRRLENLKFHKQWLLVVGHIAYFYLVIYLHNVHNIGLILSVRPSALLSFRPSACFISRTAGQILMKCGMNVEPLETTSFLQSAISAGQKVRLQPGRH
jgi:hypothetical protein